MLDLLSAGGGALRGAGYSGGAGDYLPATDDTDLNTAAGLFTALGTIIVFPVPGIRLRAVDFSDGLRGTLGTILLPARADDIPAAADQAGVDVPQVPGVTGKLILFSRAFCRSARQVGQYQARGPPGKMAPQVRQVRGRRVVARDAARQSSHFACSVRSVQNTLPQVTHFLVRMAAVQRMAKLTISPAVSSSSANSRPSTS